MGERAGLSAVHPGHVIGIDWQTENGLRGEGAGFSAVHPGQVGIDWNIGGVEPWTVHGKYVEKVLAEGMGHRYGEWYEMIHN